MEEKKLDEAEKFDLELIGTVSFEYEYGPDWLIDGFPLYPELLPELKELQKKAKFVTRSAKRIVMNKRVAKDYL